MASHASGPDLAVACARSLGRLCWACDLHYRSGRGGPNERQRAHANPTAVDGLGVPVHGLSGPVHRFSLFLFFI